MLKEFPIFVWRRRRSRICRSPLSALEKKFLGTNTEFLFRLYLEGMEILQDGDSLVKTFDFSCEQLGHIRECASDMLTDPVFEGAAIERIRTLPKSLRAVSTFYEQKMAQSEIELARNEAASHLEYERLNHLWRTENYDKILDYFPHAASLIYDEGTTEVPAQQSDVRSFLRVRMAEAFKRATQEIKSMKWEDVLAHPQNQPAPLEDVLKQPQNVCLSRSLGKPEPVIEIEKNMSALRRDGIRNGTVLRNIQNVIKQLEDIFQPVPHIPANVPNVVPFRRLAALAASAHS